MLGYGGVLGAGGFVGGVGVGFGWEVELDALFGVGGLVVQGGADCGCHGWPGWRFGGYCVVQVGSGQRPVDLD